jgi:hypothetical protein
MRPVADEPPGRSGPEVEGRLPNLFIAGVTKAGTTSLFGYLGQHPDICPSDLKELRYFTPLRYGLDVEPLPSYTRHFRGCEESRYALEGTPGYFYGGRRTAHAIEATCPGSRIVVSLRSPADRCWSWFRFVQNRLRIPEDMDFDTYLDRCEELHRAGEDGALENQAFAGMLGGCYADWMDAWIETFDSRLKIMFFDDFVADPREVVRQLCEWLALDVTVLTDLTFEADNQTQVYRSKTFQRVAVTANRHSERFFRRHMWLKRRLRSAYFLLNSAAPQGGMPASSRARLDAFYAPYNRRLAEQLAGVGLELPNSWVV